MGSKKNPDRLEPCDNETNVILESITDGVFTVDHNWLITSFNRAASKITGVPREEALGRPCQEVFRSNMCESHCALKETLESNQELVGRAGYIIRADGSRIPISVSTAILKDSQGRILGGVETFRDLSELEALREALDSKVITSHSPKMRRVLELAATLSRLETIVLITGETGSGKELVAQAIHREGPRRDEPFVAINCAALPESLLESELFGHRKGAFTGAERDHPGVFERAGRGTLFLDEIGEITLATQVRLLRVLQEKQFIPLGGVKPKTVQARIIAATNRDLAQLVTEGKFREDLYYRINVVPLEVPPLRERPEDIPLLIESFLARAASLAGRPIPSLTPEALELLLGYDWPGNVRELQNVIERGTILARSGLVSAEALGLDKAPLRQETPGLSLGFKSARESGTREAILAALEQAEGNRTRAAQLLEIHPSTLFRWLKKLDLK